jgi:hypothetical protein
MPSSRRQNGETINADRMFVGNDFDKRHFERPRKLEEYNNIAFRQLSLGGTASVV